MKPLIFYITAILMLMSFAVAASDNHRLPPLEGVWFTCEFATRQGPPDDGCMMFDDEGFVVNGGKITYLRNIVFDDTQCRGN